MPPAEQGHSEHDEPGRRAGSGSEALQGTGQTTGPGEPLPDRGGPPAGTPNPDAVIARGGSEDEVLRRGLAATGRGEASGDTSTTAEEPPGRD